MYRKIFIYLLVAVSFGACTSELPDVRQWLQDKLNDTELPPEKRFLVFFMSEGMCATCISAETININQAELSKPIVVAGVFEKKRYFLSSIHLISDRCIPLYLHTEEYMPAQLSEYPFYGVFDRRTGSLTSIFHPQPCEPEKTIAYLRNTDSKFVP